MSGSLDELGRALPWREGLGVGRQEETQARDVAPRPGLEHLGGLGVRPMRGS